MIPLRIRLKNFMCYKGDTETLNFEGLHVACLCGDNGHGKTAILDAITWALWGVARATVSRTGTISAPNLKDLVHLGQTEMLVDLEFMAKGQQYRVVRRHTIGTGGRNPRTTLELQIADTAAPKAYRSISGSRVSETNSRIINTLNMDFKTFINTAYLSQGQADVFTTSTPSERKKCLSDMLSLTSYQRLSDAARSRTNKSTERTTQLRAEVNARQEEVQHKPTLTRDLELAKEEIAELSPKLQSLTSESEESESHIRDLDLLRADIMRREDQVKLDTSTINDLKPQVATTNRQINSYLERTSRTDKIMGRHQQFIASREELSRLDAALSKRTALDSRKSQDLRAIDIEEERTKSNLRAVQSSLADHRSIASRLPVAEAAISETQQRRSALQEQEASINRHRDTLSNTRDRIQFLTAENEQFLESMTDTRQKFDMLEQEDISCPLCRQSLDHNGQNHLRTEYRRIGMNSKNRQTRGEPEGNLTTGRSLQRIRVSDKATRERGFQRTARNSLHGGQGQSRPIRSNSGDRKDYRLRISGRLAHHQLKCRRIRT